MLRILRRLLPNSLLTFLSLPAVWERKWCLMAWIAIISLYWWTVGNWLAMMRWCASTWQTWNELKYWTVRHLRCMVVTPLVELLISSRMIAKTRLTHRALLRWVTTDVFRKLWIWIWMLANFHRILLTNANSRMAGNFIRWPKRWIKKGKWNWILPINRLSPVIIRIRSTRVSLILWIIRQRCMHRVRTIISWMTVR